ncbi:hypothetical protein [Balneatrix alpica]|uniref:hypothetical protein n=1 Tax=Balneatrix alpica TaxID=75684 RepID=UPI002738B8DE|nr:hypothetical protein [Balneatrix alpica]
MKKMLSGLVLMLAAEAAFAAACGPQTPTDICDMIKQDIAQNFVPSPANHYARYYNFMYGHAFKQQKNGLAT